MRILYVCPCWPGITEAYNDGKEPNGMPGFFYVLQEFIRQGHEVDLCIYTQKPVHFDINHMDNTHWFSKINIVSVITLRQFEKIKRIIYELSLSSTINRTVNKILRNKRYDFVYGQGNYADFAHIAANKYNIPFGLRKYGDDFAPLLKQNGLLKAAIRSPAAALSYMTKKSFILATNDGTEIDKICSRFKFKGHYDIYVWNNGFNANIREDNNEVEVLTRAPFIFQFSRFIRVKGQMDVIDAFKVAKEKGFPGHLVFAGTDDDKQYYSEIINKINEYNIKPYTHFIGKITAEQTRYLTSRSLANIVSGINYNINNVLIESLGYGGIVIVRNTPLITTIIKDKDNGFIFNDVNECAQVILDLYHEKYDIPDIRENAKKTCIKLFGSWIDRARQEVELVKKYSIVSINH